MKFLLFASLLLVTACNPLTTSRIAPPPPPATYTLEQSQQLTQPADRWWQDFNDPRLNQLQEQMFAGNLDLQQALYRLEQLEALQRAKGASLWPSLNLNGAANRSGSVSAGGEATATNSSISLAAGYEVDLWNKLKDQTTAAEFRKRAGKSEIGTLLLSLSAQLTEQYFLAVEQRAQIDLLERQVSHTQNLLEMMTERYRGGLANASELYQAQRNLATLEVQVPGYQTQLTQAENTIALLLGKTPGAIAIKQQQLPELNNVIDIGLPGDLLTRRPDVAASLLQLRAADLELAAALADRLPALNLSATLGRSANQLASGNIDGTFWSLALGLFQPLFDGGRLKAVSEQQEAVRAEQLAATQLSLLTAIKEVETSLVSELNSAEKAVRLERQRIINQNFLRVTRENYLAGLTSSSDWLNSEIAQLVILSQQISNQRQWLSHRITLARALGGSWMTEE
ncbi:MAG: efflux transporter outer membrane subunit, partial [Deltaproteobacteria bacterium]|nr:efflux transporter outer membrane subunit [Deltaproteobacteria bacterium]